jgi:hypothetical protein
MIMDVHPENGRGDRKSAPIAQRRGFLEFAGGDLDVGSAARLPARSCKPSDR